jgi:hypothetical protein
VAQNQQENVQFSSENVEIRTRKTIILPLVLYECENWSLTLKAEHRLRLFEDRVLNRIFVLRKDEMKGSWRSFKSCNLRQE